MESCQSRMQKALASYPDIAKAFEEVIFAFKENSAENRAYSMHNCVQSIAEYLYSKCNAPDCDNLPKKINMLYKAKVISAQTYVNYMSIIDFKNKYEYSTAFQETETIKLLLRELTEFLNNYSKKSYQNISLGKFKIYDLLFYRLVGLVILLIGIAYDFSYIEEKNLDNILFVSISIIYIAIGLSLLIFGKEAAKLYLKIKFRNNK